MVVCKSLEENLKISGVIKTNEHNEIILEALQDYRRWFADDLGGDESDIIKIRKIDEAIEYVRDHIADNVDKGQLGTSGTIAQSSDTGLISPDASTIINATNTISGNQITFSYSKLSTVGAGTTYREYEIFDNTNSVNWTRFLFTPLEATNYEDWNIKVRMFVRNV